MTCSLRTQHALATVAYLVMHGRAVTAVTYQARVALGAMLGTRRVTESLALGTALQAAIDTYEARQTRALRVVASGPPVTTEMVAGGPVAMVATK